MYILDRVGDAMSFDRRSSVVRAYAELVRSRVDDGWSAYLMTFMFSSLPGGPLAVVCQMQRAVERVYAGLVTRVVRRPCSPASVGRLPVLVAAADLPVARRRRRPVRDVAVNGGLHCHGVLLMPPSSRMRVPADEHFRRDQSRYVGRWGLERVDVRPVGFDPAYVAGYALKSIRSGRLSYDDAVFVLPRCASERPYRSRDAAA